MRRWTKTDFLIALLLILLLVLLGLGRPAEPAAGDPVALEGRFMQGGLVTGRAPPGTRVTLDGEAVPVRVDGRFLIGFGRDAAARSVLEAALPDGRRVTQRIEVAPQTYRIQRIDGLPETMVTPPPEVLARIKRDAEVIRAARATDTAHPMFDSGFIWPVRGRVTGVYGSQRILNGEPRQPHYGIDIAAPEGTPVMAAADGVVRVAEADMYFTGGTVLIDHGYGLNSVYSHLATLSVGAGDEVKQGEVIGTVGATGRATGAHLDWRVNLFLTRLDPALLVPPMPKAD